MRSRSARAAAIAQLAAGPKLAELPAANVANALALGEPAKRDAREEAVALAAKDPATAALVLRAWLGGTSTEVTAA
jgi:flagellar biosynthesis/type III secretory pathway M-ring protein FliF/YscJ